MVDQTLEMGRNEPFVPVQPKQEEQTTEIKLSPALMIFLEVNFIVLYYLGIMLATFWLFLDTWGNNLTLMRLLGLREQALADPLIPAMMFVIAGGVFGSVLYHIRVLFRFYLKSTNYNYRWLAKYVSAPWESAAMALVVLALIQGGLALLGGSPNTSSDATSRFASFGLGAMVGFGMRDVVAWMGNLVRTMFVTKDTPEKEQSTTEKDQPATG